MKRMILRDAFNLVTPLGFTVTPAEIRDAIKAQGITATNCDERKSPIADDLLTPRINAILCDAARKGEFLCVSRGVYRRQTKPKRAVHVEKKTAKAAAPKRKTRAASRKKEKAPPREATVSTTSMPPIRNTDWESLMSDLEAIALAHIEGVQNCRLEVSIPVVAAAAQIKAGQSLPGRALKMLQKHLCDLTGTEAPGVNFVDHEVEAKAEPVQPSPQPDVAVNETRQWNGTEPVN